MVSSLRQCQLFTRTSSISGLDRMKAVVTGSHANHFLPGTCKKCGFGLDSRTLAVSVEGESPEHNVVKMFHLNDGEWQEGAGIKPVTGSPRCSALSPSQKALAIVTLSGLEVWRNKRDGSWEHMQTLPCEMVPSSIQWSPDGLHLLSRPVSGLPQMWAWNTEERLFKDQGLVRFHSKKHGMNQKASFNPSGNLLITNVWKESWISNTARAGRPGWPGECVR